MVAESRSVVSFLGGVTWMISKGRGETFGCDETIQYLIWAGGYAGGYVV